MCNGNSSRRNKRYILYFTTVSKVVDFSNFCCRTSVVDDALVVDDEVVWNVGAVCKEQNKTEKSGFICSRIAYCNLLPLIRSVFAVCGGLQTINTYWAMRFAGASASTARLWPVDSSLRRWNICCRPCARWRQRGWEWKYLASDLPSTSVHVSCGINVSAPFIPVRK